MSENGKTSPIDPPKPMTGSVKSMKMTDSGMEVLIRLQNPNTRAMHYISDVRALDYDPATKNLTVRLSDQGLTVIPSMVSMRPTFRFVDPESEAEILISLPQTIVKLGQPSATGQVTLEEHRIADASEIAIDIAWADTQFYEDTRPSDSKELPAARWQQGKLRVSYKVPRGKN